MMPARRALALASLAAVALLAASSADAKPNAKSDEGAQFDREAAANALKSVELVKCKVSGGPRGEGHVSVTFAADGSANAVVVDKGTFMRSPVERCIVAQYKRAKVPAFRGGPVTVGKTFRID